MPLIGAISSGNCAVIKPSAYAPASSHAVRTIVESVFPPEYVAVVEGGREENKALLEADFDYIFFTGSAGVGRRVMESAARRLIPVTLELGGKSPVIVDETADIRRAARKIAFGMDSYHGKQSFDTFSHYRTVLEKHLPADVPIRYFPYSQKKARFARKILG